MDKLKIEYVPIDSIKPYKNNAKLHPDEQVEQICNSIRETGFNDPIGVWHDEIAEGHGRLLAAKKLGMKEVPIIRLDDLTDEQRRAYMLAHNKLTMNSDFDVELLDIELANIETIDMQLLGFDDAQEETEQNTKTEKTEIEYFAKDEIKKDIEANWNPKDDLKQYVNDIIDIPTAKYQFNRLCQGYRAGYNISLLFNPHRLTTKTKVSESVFYGITKDKKFAKSFARMLVDLDNVTTQCNYFKYLGIGTGGYQFVNEFQPYLARDIYKKYCKNGSRILNPCAGWGGRLIGLASCMFSDIEYVETEPSTATYNGLKEIKKFLRLGNEYKQFNLPFEELDVKKEYFDFVFTSPPYFDTEKYSDEETQSYIKNDTYETWVKNFLCVMIDKIVFCMKKDAFCVLNVGNKKYPISTDIIEYLQNKYGIKAGKDKDFKLDSNENVDGAIRSAEEDFIVFQKCD